jgi:nicotinamide-nucleotide amidase
MVLEEMLSRLDQRFPRSGGFACRTLKTTGLGESYMEELLDVPLKDLVAGGMDLGFCARVGEVDVRFVARGPEAQATVAEAERRTRAVAGNYIFGVDDETLEAVLVRDFSERGLTLALAESCTGGHIANRLTNVPGASAVLRAGLVTYANEAKASQIGVPMEMIATHGAVSEEVARAMAEGALRESGADFALSVTGIAGPSGGTEEKPVGTAWLGLAEKGGETVSRKVFHPRARKDFKQAVSQSSLDLLRHRRVL